MVFLQASKLYNLAPWNIIQKLFYVNRPWCQFHQHFMSSFFAQRSQKDTDDLTVFFALWRSARQKSARKTLVKSTPEEIYSKVTICLESSQVLVHRQDHLRPRQDLRRPQHVGRQHLLL